MDFFSHQDQARRATRWLIVYFVLTVIAIIATIYIAVVAVGAWATRDAEVPFAPLAWHPQLLLTVIGTVLATITVGCLYKMWELGGSGERVAIALGGTRVPPNTSQLDKRILLNVVEEMALASGTTVPPVFIMENETGVNAFAAGTLPQNAVIGITRGALDVLNRDQLQGVIAHEFSHILNGDMRLNLRLISLLHGILMIAMIGYFVIRLIQFIPSRSSSSDDDGKATIAIIALAAIIGATLLAVGYIGVFFANLIQAAVSRQREFLADASAVQFTRNPQGIADALKRIGGWKQQAAIQHLEAKETSHMFFGQGVSSLWFATHPPLAVRIARLDPQFKGQFPKTEITQHSESELIDPRSLSHLRSSLAGSHQAALAGVDHFETAPQDAVESVGNPLPQHVEHAHQMVDDIDARMIDEVREPLGAVAVVYAMLLAPPGDANRDAQLKMIRESDDRRVIEELNRVIPWVDGLEVEQRLPIACMAFPSLGQLSERQAQAVQRTVRRLIEADRQWSFFEYAVQRFVSKRLVLNKQSFIRDGRKTLASLGPAFQMILSSLAHMSNGDDSSAMSFEAGKKVLKSAPRGLICLPREQCTLKALDQALNQLETACPSACKEMLNAFCACVAADGMATLREMEVLRVVSDALGCPMPPILDLH